MSPLFDGASRLTTPATGASAAASRRPTLVRIRTPLYRRDRARRERSGAPAGEVSELALGFLNFAIGTDIQREGLMEATLQRTEGAPGGVEELLAALLASLRERISVTLVDEPVVTLD
jgi:hypothetical protein